MTEYGTVEQQEIQRLKEIEKDLLMIIERTDKSPNDRPENLRASRLLNQVQLKRLQLQVNDLR